MSRNGTILIVDDEPNVRLGFRTALTTAGYAVGEAENGPDALDHLDRSAYDLVLLDLLMPGLGGIDVLRRLHSTGNEVPVVIVTGHGNVPDAVTAMKLGAVDLIVKPLAPTELRRVVREVLVRHDDSAPVPSQGARRLRPPISVTVGPAAVDLTPAKRALDRREFDRAVELIEQALDVCPYSAGALTLLGIVRERRGQDNAAYHLYKAALGIDPDFGPACENMRRYCMRAGLDHTNKAINPGAG